MMPEKLIVERNRARARAES